MSRLFKTIFLIFVSNAVASQSALEIIELMYRDASKIEGFIAEINKVERIEDEYIIQLSTVKLNRAPYKVYIKQIAPKQGVEILVHQNDDDNKKAIINLNSFPWINLYLDPYGSLMRRNQHHLVFDSGFDLMIKILKHELKDHSSDEKLIRRQDVIWKGEKMYHLELINNNYKIISYVVKPNENVDIIANKLNINAYSIIELNKNIDGYNDIEVGQEIKIPSNYAKSMDLFIDQKTNIPLVIKVFDDKGLYEKYEYNSIILNPIFAPNEFLENFEAYNF